jgi:hypothetical protein
LGDAPSLVWTVSSSRNVTGRGSDTLLFSAQLKKGDGDEKNGSVVGFGSLAVLLASEVAWAATNTFSNPSSIAIPDGSGAATLYPSAVSVSGLGSVTDVDLKLNGFSGTYPQRVKAELVGPSGASATVMSDAGGDYALSNIDLTLDDEATSTLPSWNRLSSGTYKPRSPLSVFDGTNPNGVWELYVENVEWGDPGSFSGGWSLTITSEGTAEPPPPDTALREKPSALSSDVNARFVFRSSETGSTFECKLDGGTYQSCTAPKRYFVLPECQHTFAVRATDSANNTDPSPAEYTWTVDSLDPEITFTERAGNATGPDEWDDSVTNDRSPTWAWTVQDPNLVPDSGESYLYDYTHGRTIIDEPCSSPYTFEGELPDGDYEFGISVRDKANNYGYANNYFEVDTIAPKVVSGKPTGRRVNRWANVLVTFDDYVYDSKQFVNIYKGISNTPLAVYRYAYGDEEIEISPQAISQARYTVKVTTGVNDGANNLEAPYSWSFKTRG